jgi:hypothetical protein
MPTRARRGVIEPEDDGPTGDEDTARIWDEMTLTINLGSYESVKITTGTSRSVLDTPASLRREHRRLVREHERMLGDKAAELRAMWGNTD